MHALFDNAHSSSCSINRTDHVGWSVKPRMEAAGIAKRVLPRRLLWGALDGQFLYFPHKLPVALDGLDPVWWTSSVFV